MLINGKEVKAQELINDFDFEQNMRQPVNDSLDLTGYQMDVLARYQIDYKNVSSLKELIYLIEEVLNETDAEELELISSELAERDYYENTDK